MAEIMSAEKFAEEVEAMGLANGSSDLVRARDKAMVERIREKIDKHGIITRQWQLNSILDDVLREIGGE